MPTSISYDTRDVVTVIGQLRDVDKALRTNASGELRDAAGHVAQILVGALQSGAGGTPQAPLVASSAKVKRDRVPAVQLGGGKAVGRRGTAAGVLLWGSERGGRNFAAPPNASGYWIGPAVRRVQEGDATSEYLRAVSAILRAAGVL